MARNRNQARNKRTLLEEIAEIRAEFLQLRLEVAVAIAPEQPQTTNATTCRVGDLSVEHLGSWIVISDSPNPRDAHAGRLVGLRPAPPHNNPAKSARILVVQQGSEQAGLEYPTNIIALLGSGRPTTERKF